MLTLSEEKRAVHTASDVVEQERANEVTAAGQRFRVVYVERLVRIERRRRIAPTRP
jgi:hypothetical protein